MKSTSRFLVLDGMRGVAAAMVFLHHALPSAAGWSLLPRGYLAVDFFFMLSGFVLTRGFEPRFAAGLNARTFMAMRLRRLYPTIAFGIVFGAFVMAASGASAMATIRALATELLFLPSIGGGMLGIFRLDGVEWSLLFELLANAVHAIALYKLSTRRLTMLAVVALVALVLVVQSWGSLAVGDRGATFIGGVPRVLFAYLVGIVLGRADKRWPRHQVIGPVAPITLLIGAVTLPALSPTSWPVWVVDLVVVAIIFPVVLVRSAAAELSPVGARLASMAGSLSYPLYATHIPAIGLTVALWGSGVGQGAVLLVLCLTVVTAVTAETWLLTERLSARSGGRSGAHGAVAGKVKSAWLLRKPGALG